MQIGTMRERILIQKRVVHTDSIGNHTVPGRTMKNGGRMQTIFLEASIGRLPRCRHRTVYTF